GVSGSDDITNGTNSNVVCPVIVQAGSAAQFGVEVLSPVRGVRGAHHAAESVNGEETIRGEKHIQNISVREAQRRGPVRAIGRDTEFGEEGGRSVGIVQAHIVAISIDNLLDEVGADGHAAAPVQSVGGDVKCIAGGASELKEFAVCKREAAQRIDE